MLTSRTTSFFELIKMFLYTNEFPGNWLKTMVPGNDFMKLNVRHHQKVSFSTGKVARMSSNYENGRNISTKTPVTESF